MALKEDAAALKQRFSTRYQLAGSEIVREIERATCGCDYGATSWTTRDEAMRVARLLELGPGKRLLDIGAGSGWPGLFIADETGCDLVLSDPIAEGIAHAARRAAKDRPEGACYFAAADGTALPFRSGWFDAVSHSDVLCCLEDKRSALEECLRVIRGGGKMVFTVISIMPGLSAANHETATGLGPVFVDSDTEYPDLLRQTGWKILDSSDMTAAYGRTVKAVLDKESANADRLVELFGEQATAERLGRRRRALEGFERGFIRRDMYVTAPAAPV